MAIIALLHFTARHANHFIPVLDSHSHSFQPKKSSTLSRIHSGENADPYFKTILALSEAFVIDLDFFSTEMTLAQVEEYLTSPNKQQILQDLQLQQFYDTNEERNQKIQHIALRAAQLDDEGINAIADIIDYVLKQKGIKSAPEGESF